MTPEEKLELEKAQAAAAAATALAKRFESIAKFDDQTKAHFNALDEAGQTAFLGKSEDAQKADVAAFHKAKTDEDPVVFKADDGTEYRKSDDPRLVEMAREHDADRKALEKSQKVAKQVDLEKRAGELMPNIPGTIQVRAAMLEKAESIEDEETRKGAIEALKASNAAMDPLFKMNGSRGAAVVEGSAEDQLDKLAADLAKKENISQAQAYNKVLETPEGERLYNEHRSRGSASVTVN